MRKQVLRLAAAGLLFPAAAAAAAASCSAAAAQQECTGVERVAMCAVLRGQHLAQVNVEPAVPAYVCALTRSRARRAGRKTGWALCYRRYRAMRVQEDQPHGVSTVLSTAPVQGRVTRRTAKCRR